MSEISERDLRRRLARQNDSAFAARVSFAELTAGAVQPSRRPVRRVVFAVLALVAILGAGVAIVAVRRPVAPTTPAVSVPAPPPATIAATQTAEELARSMIQADDAPRPLGAECKAMTDAERAAASVDFGQTSLPLYTCTLTFTGVADPVPYRVSLLPNGCFVSHPVDKRAKPSAIMGCGVTPAPPLTGMAQIAQDLGGGIDITGGVVSRLTAEIAGESVQLVTYRGQRNLTCFIAVATKTGATKPELADGPVCPSVGDARNIDARVVRLRPSKTPVLTGTVATNVTGLRLTRGDQITVYDVPQTTIPGTGGRHPFLVDITGASQLHVLAGSEGVGQYGLNGKSFPAPVDSLHDPMPTGRTFAYLLGMARQGESFVLDADPADFLTGAEAASYCVSLGDADCELDYTIANPDGRVHFGTISPTAQVVLVDRAYCCVRTIEITVAELAALVNKGGAPKLFWVTAFANGVVTKLEEQYVP